MEAIIDYNLMLFCAHRAFSEENFRNALAIYLFLAEKDPSLEGGSTADNISRCYEKMGDAYSAKYWARLAFEENPDIDIYKERLNQFQSVNTDSIISEYRLAYSDPYGLSKKTREKAARSGRDVWPP